MFCNAKNCSVKIGDTDMDYISFGRGDEHLVIIPGLGDGLATVKGTALWFSVLYKIFSKHYQVWVFSRKNRLEDGYSTRDMARDLKAAMDALGISRAAVMGVSQGGMIAQYVAIDFPETVEKLILAVTASRPNETLRHAVGGWMEMAQANDYRGIVTDTAEKSYSERRLKWYRVWYPLLGRIGRPREFGRLMIQAQSCLNHNAYEELNKIKCPTLVIGGDSDQVVGGEALQEITQRIPGSQLVLYKGLGHGAYEEAKDFPHQVLQFLDSDE